MQITLNQWSLPDWASIAGFFIVIFNAWQITRLKRRIVLSLTLDSLLRRLQTDSMDLNECLQLYRASIDRFDATVEVCKANVSTLCRRLGLRNGWFCLRVLRAIRVYQRGRDEEAARSVYNRLQGVVQEVANRVEEVRISGA